MPITPDLFTPLQLGQITLPNRVIMAPMTRCRAGAGNVPQEVNARFMSLRNLDHSTVKGEAS